MQNSAETVRRHSTVAQVIEQHLLPLATQIDQQGLYPQEIMHKLGRAGAYAGVANAQGYNFADAITATTTIAQVCASTAFCSWCQNALVWYLRNTENTAIADKWLNSVATGNILGGTGLSIPMKSLHGLASLSIAGTKEGNGYRVSGAVPWVSNISEGNVFGVVFRAGSAQVMALVDSTMDGVSLMTNARGFAVLEGSATVSARLLNVYIPPERIIAEDATSFMRRIRPGFILLQTGIGLGIIREAIKLVRQKHQNITNKEASILLSNSQHMQLHANEFALRIDEFANAIDKENTINLKELLQLRLSLAEKASLYAMAALVQHGAAGLLRGSRTERLLREAAFFNVLTPSVCHLAYALN